MGKRTDRSVIDVVPNGVAFNLAKSWLGLVKKDDEDDGNADRSKNENLNNNNNETFSLEAFRRESQREEEETSASGRHGGKGGGSQRANTRLGLGAKYTSHSKAARTMQTIAEKKIFDRVQREKHTRRMEEKERERESSSDEDEDEEDVRGLSKSKKRKMERFDASTYRRK
jgi:hypothetical protein|tara:strand:- start:793 stop:1305 length:513 start_codon:yes stop_codon:yes gene_type:complete